MKETIKIQSIKSHFLSNFRSIFGETAQIDMTCNKCIERFHNDSHHHGLNYAIKSAKEVERHVRMTFLRQESSLSLWIRTNSMGLPQFLGLEPNLIRDPEYQRAVLTALGYYRLYSLPPDDSVINGITEGGSQDILPEMLEEIGTYARNFFQNMGIQPFQPSPSLPIYATTKAGASQHSAMGEASISDAKSIYDLGLWPLLLKVVNQTYTKESVIKFQDIYQRSLDLFKFTFKYFPISGRIHLISEPGGKTRAICIPDIWTQSALKPIHEYFMDVLRKLPHDGTFSHPASAERLRVITNHHSLYCFDLTAATDRFPLSFQKVVLKPLLGDLVEDWSSLLVERDFHYKGRLIRYGVGQPMGMLSSWAAFSISHHILINYCIDRAEKSADFYEVIGDDMAMQSKEAAEMYRFMLSILGVSINDQKSLTPTGKDNIGEIAKRYFRNGYDLSPIPPKVLLESTKSLSGFIEFLEVLESRTSTSSVGTGLDWSERLTTLWKHNVDYSNESALAVLTCPAFLKGLSTGIHRAPLTGFTPQWDITKKRMITNLWERFVLDEAVSQLNTKLMEFPLTPDSRRPDPSKTVRSPILAEYLQCKLEELRKVAKIYGGSYVDEEADSFEPDPSSTLTKFLTEPDPFSPRDFEEKRRIRRKRSVQLIQKFWTKHRKVIIPQVPTVPNVPVR